MFILLQNQNYTLVICCRQEVAMFEIIYMNPTFMVSSIFSNLSFVASEQPTANTPNRAKSHIDSMLKCYVMLKTIA